MLQYEEIKNNLTFFVVDGTPIENFKVTVMRVFIGCLLSGNIGCHASGCESSFNVRMNCFCKYHNLDIWKYLQQSNEFSEICSQYRDM